MTDRTPPSMPWRITFIGLGVMGAPIAGHLARAGHEITVYNRTVSKAQDWVKHYGGRMAATPRAAAVNAQLVCTCVGNDDDLRSVVLGDSGVLSSMAPDSVLIDHTTASAEVARELHAAAAQRAVHFMDAPVSGGQSGATQGQLSVMCGGNAEVFARVQPIIATYARACTLLGPVGNGQLTKMVNQICIAGLLQGLAEALAFGRTAGLDMTRVLSVISQGAAQSWQMEHRGTTMLADQFDFGFAVDWMRKDLAICLDEARRQGTTLPVTALIDQFYADLQTQGGGRWDTSSLIRRLQH